MSRLLTKSLASDILHNINLRKKFFVRFVVLVTTDACGLACPGFDSHANHFFQILILLFKLCSIGSKNNKKLKFQ